ncbi:MAG: hypothetical protein MRZ79_19015 [Bacteroidia bacterium]|nr:hypothetical protein [Bacteroidia bacterium]
MGQHKSKYPKRGKGLLSLLITAFILQLIWNALVPELFNGPVLSYIQAVLIILIKRLITGGMNWQGSCKGSYDWDKKEWKEKWGSCDQNDWKNHFDAKWKEMEQDHEQHEADMEAERQAEEEANRENEEYKEGFQKDGKFDVNVVDVEDEPSEDEEEGKDEGSSDEDDK